MSDELKRIGAQMANVMFNLAQLPGERITYQQAETFDKLRKEWDAAVRATPSTSTAPTEQNQAADLDVLPPFAAPANQHDVWIAATEKVSNALTLAMAICDATPTRAHDLAEDESLRHLGKLVNCDVGTGQHGYAVIRDGQAAFAEVLAAGAAREGGNTNSNSPEFAGIKPASTAPVEEDERASFEAWWYERSLNSWQSSLLASEYGQPMPEGWGDGYKRHAREAWQARAALASKPAAREADTEQTKGNI